MIIEGIVGEEFIKGGSVRRNRNGVMMIVKDFLYLGVRGGERIFKEVRERLERLEED